jgi:hypothetical protein
MLALCLIVGCGTSTEYGSTCVYLRNRVVRLPWQERLGTENVGVDIRAIPGRTDAVQVKADLFGYNGYTHVEWIQEGCSEKQFPIDFGAQRWDFSFLEMRAAEDAVSEVKLSIVVRYNNTR